VRYKKGDKVIFGNKEAEIEFLYPKYKKGRDAYTIKFERGGMTLRRLCFEDELTPFDWIQVTIFDLGVAQ
jgi:hypothetical protein